MKKTICALLLTLIALAGCQGKSGLLGDDGNLIVDSVSIDSTAALQAGSASPCATLSLSLTFVKPANSTEAARHAAQNINACLLSSYLLMPEYADNSARQKAAQGATSARMSDYLHRYAKRFFKTYRDDCLELYRDDKENAAFYGRIYRVYTQMKMGADSIANYTARILLANDNDDRTEIIWARNFNTHTGATVLLADVLRPGYERPLAHMAATELTRRSKAVHDNGDAMAMIPEYVPDNYIISRKGITLIYNKEDVGAANADAACVSLTYKQLEPLLRKKK